VLSTAAVVALAKADGGAEFAAFPNGSVGPWPPILAYATLGWVIVALTVFGPTREAAGQISQSGHPVQLALLAVLGGLFALLYSRAVREAAPASATLAYLVAAALVAILLAPELISTYFQLPFIVDGRWLVILTTTALGTHAAVFGTANAKAAGLPH
jgi:preprotein translocase subunit SecY